MDYLLVGGFVGGVRGQAQQLAPGDSDGWWRSIVGVDNDRGATGEAEQHTQRDGDRGHPPNSVLACL